MGLDTETFRFHWNGRLFFGRFYDCDLGQFKSFQDLLHTKHSQCDSGEPDRGAFER